MAIFRFLFLFIFSSTVCFAQVDVAIESINIIPPGPYTYGSSVTFSITLRNNSAQTVTNIALQDIVPCGLSYIGGTPAWSPSGSNRITTYTTPILPNGTAVVTIDFILQACTTPNAWLNTINITDYTDVSNISLFSQDTNAGNNTGNATPPIYDLALRKTLATPPPYQYNDVLTFNIEVFNQGNQTVNGFIINDYLPVGVGYLFDPLQNPGWSLGPPNTYNRFVNVNLPPGSMELVTIKLILLPTNGGVKAWVNYAEIAQFYDAGGFPAFDADSTPGSNTISENNVLPGSPNDNNLNSTGLNNNDDDDDHDPASVNVFDLALIKMQGSALSSFSYLQDIEYIFTVYNQGSIAATNIEITDSLGGGLQFMATPKNIGRGWVYNNLTKKAKMLYTKILLPGQSDTIKLDLMPIQHYVDPYNAWNNYAEISSADDTDPATLLLPLDIDSKYDDIMGNDAGGRPNSPSDNAINGNGTGVPNDAVAATDEDDMDVHKVQIFDLALTKIKFTPGTFFQVGQDVRFDLTIFNQGNVPAKNIIISDYVPAGFNFIAGGANTGWTGGNPLVKYTYVPTLMPGNSTTMSITLRVVSSMAQNAYVNYAEVSAAMDTLNNNRNDDADSILDDNPNNDNQVVSGSPDDNNILGNSFYGTDEDDHDVASIQLLCQRPTLSVGIPQCDPGNGTYSITYYSNVTQANISSNAGTVGATKVTGIPFGTNVTITAQNGQNCSQSLTVNSPSSCPGTGGCTYPKLTVGQPLCTGLTYSVSYATDMGTISTSIGTISATAIINIPIGSNVTVMATNGSCVSTMVVTSPANCDVDCANSPISISGPICEPSGGGTYKINYIIEAGVNVIASAGVLNNGMVTGIPSGVDLTLTVTKVNCITRVIVVPAGDCPICQRPTLTVGIPQCDPGNGTYSVTYYSNVTQQNISSNTGSVSATRISGIPLGTNVIITAQNGLNCSQSLTVPSPSSCPGTGGCTYPQLTVGQPLCNGNVWSVSFTSDIGVVSVSPSGTVSGNSIINIPIGTDITVISTVGNCIARVNVTSPINCSIPCANSPISISGPICETNGAGTYKINFITEAGVNVVASAGTVANGMVTGIPSGVDLTLTVTKTNCITRQIVIPAGTCLVCQKPTLTVGIPICDPGNGTYSVTYYSSVTQANISTNTGTIGATMISGIPLNQDVTIHAANGPNCSQSLTVLRPSACPGTNGCIYPSLTVGQPICNGNGLWSVSFSSDLGTVTSAPAGTVSGNIIQNIPIGTNVTISATNGNCVSRILVNSPTNCGVPCANSPISISGPVCESGSTYKINFIAEQNVMVVNSAGILSAGMVTGVPSGTNLILTVTTQGCPTRVITIPGINCIPQNGSVSNFVWHDLNGDGQQNIGEPGLPGIIVMLYNQITGFVAQKTTGAGGLYIFNDVLPGNYYVRVLAPTGWDFTFPDIGSDASDSDIGSFNGAGTSAIFTLASGQNNSTIDAGLFRCSSIGSLVWYDTNRNDIYSISEHGINGIKVNLWRNHFGVWKRWDTKYTGPKPGSPSDDGYFLFCAPPGTYYVEVIMPPLGLVRARKDIGSNDAIDSDVNSQGKTDNFTVTSGQSKLNIGAGFYPMAVAGNLVWRDDNINGRQDIGEAKVEGVKVEAIDISTGTVTATALTNSEGEYMLDYLENIDYYLKFTIPSGFSATIPKAANDEMDSDVDHSFGLNTTRAISMESGTTNNNIDLGIAFGVLPVHWVDVVATRAENTNIVQWKVNNEVNVSHYIVEGKKEGALDFAPVSQHIFSYKKQSGESQYSFYHKDIISKDGYYYRIKQFDFDGTEHISKIVYLHAVDNEDFFMYPNPASDVINLDIYGNKEDLTIEILDGDARLVKKQSVTKDQTTIDVSSLTNGVYIVRVLRSNSVITDKKVILIK